MSEDMDKKPRASRKDDTMAKKKMEASRAGFIALKQMEQSKRNNFDVPGGEESQEFAIGNVSSGDAPVNPPVWSPPSPRQRYAQQGNKQLSMNYRDKLLKMESAQSNMSRSSSGSHRDVDVKDSGTEEPREFAVGNRDSNVGTPVNPPLWSPLPRLSHGKQQLEGKLQFSRYHAKMASYSRDSFGSNPSRPGGLASAGSWREGGPNVSHRPGFLARITGGAAHKSRSADGTGKRKSLRYLEEVHKFDKLVRREGSSKVASMPAVDSQATNEKSTQRGGNRVSLRQLEEKHNDGSCPSSLRLEGLGDPDAVRDPFAVENEDPDSYARSCGPGAVYVHDVYGQSNVLSKGHLTAPPRQTSMADTSHMGDLLLTREEEEINYTPIPMKNCFCGIRFKLLFAVTVIAFVAAIGVAVPSSRSGPSNLAGEEVAASSEKSSVNLESRRQAVRSLLSSVSNPGMLDQAGSPQNLALQWIVNDDELTPIDSTALPMPSRKLINRYALAVFFYSTGGDTSWTFTGNWLDAQVEECNWNFIECNIFGEVDAIKTGDTFGNSLKGPIPNEISVLSSLHTLAFPANEISSLPDELGKLTNLVILDLYSNAVAGSIPPVIYELSKLERLSLGVNLLTGNVSPSISNLSRLNTLDLNSNNLSGILPIDSLPLGLQYLILKSNSFEGSLTGIISRLTNLTYLDLHINEFEGSIPTEIGNLRNLDFLFLDYNDISSTLPTEIGLVTSLTFLRIVHAKLTGTIPTELSNLSNLVVLQIEHNSFSGSFPTEVCKLRPPEGGLDTLSAPCSVDCQCCTHCK